VRLGIRLARPGEFTERAFLNGKIDLIQAEAVADLIASTTALGAKLAIRSLQGAFSRRVRAISELLSQLRVHLEATLDFPEEEVDSDDRQVIEKRLRVLISDMKQLLREAKQGERIREGLEIVIAGPTNAGKSSLLNLLTNSDSAIVTPIPGTTRDPLRVGIQIDGLPVWVTDTAGLRVSDDHLEKLGVDRAWQRIAQSDLVLWVYDCTMGWEKSELDKLPPNLPIILIRNKIDLLSGKENHPVIIRSNHEEIALSTITAHGIDDLRRSICGKAHVSTGSEGAFVARRRHISALQRCLELLSRAYKASKHGLDQELIAFDLRSAQQTMGEITGEVTPDDLLNRIFSSFCIGK